VSSSLWFCLAITALALVGSVVLGVLWLQGKLTATLTFEPETMLWIAGGATIFIASMLVANLLEWRKLRAAA